MIRTIELSSRARVFVIRRVAAAVFGSVALGSLAAPAAQAMPTWLAPITLSESGHNVGALQRRSVAGPGVKQRLGGVNR